MTYADKLLSQDWKNKRLTILERDSYTCRECKNEQIVENSRSGTVSNLILRDNELAALCNKSDPRFRFERPKYELFFNIESGKEVSFDVYLDGWDKEEEKDSIIGMPGYFIVDNIELPDTGEKQQVVIITGIKNKNGGWFYVGNLHVHHTYYQHGREPWEYPNDALLTLCWDCHESLHSKKEVPRLNSNGQRIDSLMPCQRCAGIGYFPEFRHVQNGICFRCGGARYEEFI